MNQEIIALVRLLSLGKISKEDFLHAYFGGTIPDEGHVLEMIQRGIRSNDADLIDESLTLIYTEVFKLEVL